MTRGLGGQRHAGEDSPLLGVVDMADECITSTSRGTSGLNKVTQG
ncbi:hypothetical protein [Synechococcus sp. UW105]|nr:hypothetical protein [Synechococcus sp. UW105]